MGGLRASIFLRVLAVVLGSGLVALGLAAFTAVSVVRDHLEAQLVETAFQRAQEISTKLDHAIELSRAESNAVAFAVDAGRPLEIPQIVSSRMQAIVCRRGEDVLFEASTTEEADAVFSEASTPPPGQVVIADTYLIMTVETGEIRSTSLVDATQILSASGGWSVRVNPSEAEGAEDINAIEDLAVMEQVNAGGVLARRERDSSGEEYVRAVTRSRNDLVVEVRAPLEPARTAAYAVMQRIVLWASVVVLPLLILAWLLSRAVTSPVRSLASAMRNANGEGVELPPLPRDEIGDLGAAIHSMSERLSEDARAMRTAVEFARRVNLMREEVEVIGALEDALNVGIPSGGWRVLSRTKIEDYEESELEGIPVDLLQLIIEAEREDEAPAGGKKPKNHREAFLRASSQSIPVVRSTETNDAQPLLHLVLRHGESVFGIVIGQNVQEASVDHAELLCRAAGAVLRNLELFRSVLANEKLVVLGRVVAGVAHEVNNPLAFVLANLRALEGELTGPQHEAVTEAREGAERMGRIIGDLSTLSRGGMQVNLVESDLAAVAREAVQMAQARCPSGQINLDAPNSVLINGDPDRLMQVIANLIINGIEAAQDRQVQRVEVEVRGGESTVTVDVEDNGTGIPKSVLPRLFDAFFTSKGDKGTGLGLFISRSLAQAHGGELKLLATGVHGTRFRLELPHEVVEHDSFSPIPSVSHLSSIPPKGDHRPSILVIDDELALVRALERWLGRWATVTGTGDPLKGLELAEKGSFDLVLCDIDMPKMSGQEFLKLLRERDGDIADRVVLMTGSSSGEVPGVKVLRKPLDEEILRNLVYDEDFRQ